jgi:hypothetical protein
MSADKIRAFSTSRTNPAIESRAVLEELVNLFQFLQHHFHRLSKALQLLVNRIHPLIPRVQDLLTAVIRRRSGTTLLHGVL